MCSVSSGAVGARYVTSTLKYPYWLGFVLGLPCRAVTSTSSVFALKNSYVSVRYAIAFIQARFRPECASVGSSSSMCAVTSCIFLVAFEKAKIFRFSVLRFVFIGGVLVKK